MDSTVISMKNITKEFKGTTALNNINLDIYNNEIHALLGENGAGKSTLIKILTGAYKPEKGVITVNSQEYNYIPVRETSYLGISAVYQDLKLAPDISIMENVLMGHLPRKAKAIIDKERAIDISNKALKRVGLNLSPKTIVKDLTPSERVFVAIAKVLSQNPKLLILDEPTALLTENEVNRLFEILRSLTKDGISILYISHKLEEIFEICDRITVLRDGEKMWTNNISEITNDYLIESISGNHIINSNFYKESSKLHQKELLKIENIKRDPHLHNISFNLNSHEIVGLYGLVGSGKTELLRCIFGRDKEDSGNVIFKNKPYNKRNPKRSIELGMGFIPEDRGNEGIFPNLSLNVNANITTYERIHKKGFINPKREKERTLQIIKRLNVKYNDLNQNIEGLSGGNQQKIILSRWTDAKFDTLLLDEPTAGIDVGARQEIYKMIRKQVDDGVGVIYSSSYLPEIMEIADRIIVLSNHRITGEFTRRKGFSELSIMKAAYK